MAKILLPVRDKKITRTLTAYNITFGAQNQRRSLNYGIQNVIVYCHVKVNNINID